MVPSMIFFQTTQKDKKNTNEILEMSLYTHEILKNSI